jgi:hypothetical protein
MSCQCHVQVDVDVNIHIHVKVKVKVNIIVSQTTCVDVVTLTAQGLANPTESLSSGRSRATTATLRPREWSSSAMDKPITRRSVLAGCLRASERACKRASVGVGAGVRATGLSETAETSERGGPWWAVVADWVGDWDEKGSGRGSSGGLCVLQE